MPEEKQNNMPTKSGDTVNDIATQVKDLIQQGNARRVIIRTAEGNKLVEISLTVVAALGLLLIFLPGGLLMAIIGTVIAIFARVRLEIVRELDDDDDVLEMQLPDEKSKNE